VALDLPTIRSAANAQRILWRYHALMCATQRGISREQALRVIQEGEILEQQPRARPYPTCLMMHMMELNRPLYVALAHDQAGDYLHIITVHWLDPSTWEDPGRDGHNGGRPNHEQDHPPNNRMMCRVRWQALPYDDYP
jgi:hypothetical protein